MTRRQAFRAWETHLEEAIGVTDAETVLDHLDQRVTGDDLAALEARLDAKLEALEARLDAKLEALEARLDAKLEALEARLDAKLEALEARLDAQTQRLVSMWRRDLLLIITGQFVALAGVLTAIT
jgi:Skp family chaperone for outer membrane proteins